MNNKRTKKGEGKKRTSPFTPYREKGKVKEQYRVSCETSILKPARAHARLRCTCSYEEAGAAAVERVRRRFGNKYAKVARAYFNRKPWQKTGLPRRTFYYALKKSKKFFMPINIGRSCVRREEESLAD